MRHLYALALATLVAGGASSLPDAAAQALGPLGLGVDLGTAIRAGREQTEHGATSLVVAGLVASLRLPSLPGTRVRLYAVARGEIGAGRSAGYRFVPVQDGSDRALCVDADTGQPVGRGACVSTYSGVSLDGGVAVPVLGTVVRLGAGYRTGTGSGPIAAVTVSGARLLYLRGEAGPRGGALVFGLGSF